MPDPVRAARQELQRVGLLADVGAAAAAVPDVILRSWRRSLGSVVAPDGVPERFAEVDVDSDLYRAAEPVLDHWQEHLRDTDASVFLGDRAGRIVARRSGGPATRRRLDRVHAVEGFDYSEESVGTNGLGTAIAEGRAVHVHGSQHYSEALADLSCAAVPVRASSGVIVGSVSLGGPARSAPSLLLPLTYEIGRQIEQRLHAASRPQDLTLALSFTRYANARRPTVVLDGESVMANMPGLAYLDVAGHIVLWERLVACDWSAVGGGEVRLDLPALGRSVTARRVVDGSCTHYVAHFDAPSERVRPIADAAPVETVAATVDGMVVVDGPRGSGRATLAMSEHRRSCPCTPDALTLETVDGDVWGSIRARLAVGCDVLARRAECLDDAGVRELSELVAWHHERRRASGRCGALLLTVDTGIGRPALGQVLDGGVILHTVALSRRPERLPGLIREVLDRCDTERRLILSPAALQALARWHWPGNFTELEDTVSALVQGTSGSVIDRHDLPAKFQGAATRRRLSLIEEAERAAIVRVLRETRGNKSEAAALLGLGRTTLYRRLRQLGVEADENLSS